MSEIKERLKEACNGHPNAVIPWPHRLLHDAIDAICEGEKRIALLEAVAEAAVEADLVCEEAENSDGIMVIMPMTAWHEVTDQLDVLRAAGYLQEQGDD